jgi:hypothetical protein
MNIIDMARKAGRTGVDYMDWTATDEVQKLADEGAFSSDKTCRAIEKAYEEGVRDYKRATWRVVWTTAPSDYDTMGTETLATEGDWFGKPLRQVAIDPKHYVYQTARYRSGLHQSWDKDPRVEEARAKAKRDERDAEDRKRAEIRAAGLEWIKTAELSDDDVAAWEDRGLTYQDVREEWRRRDAEAAEKSRTDEWARCVAAVPEGCTIVDEGEPSKRGVYGVIPGRDPHVYHCVHIVKGWPDDADHASVASTGGREHDVCGSLSYVAEWLASGRVRIARPDEILPPPAVLARIGHEKWKDIRRVTVDSKTVWIGTARFAYEPLVLDAEGHIVRSKKVRETALLEACDAVLAQGAASAH